MANPSHQMPDQAPGGASGLGIVHSLHLSHTKLLNNWAAPSVKQFQLLCGGR